MIHTIFTISLCLCIVGFFAYLHEVLQNRVDRFTRWRDLTIDQWFYLVMAVQFPIVTISLIVWRHA